MKDKSNRFCAVSIRVVVGIALASLLGAGVQGQSMQPRRIAAAGQRAAARRNQRAANRMNNQQIITQLRSARSLLEQADHDYQGHRARAVGFVSAAIRDLRGRAGQTGTNSQNAVRANAGGTGTATNAGTGAGAGKAAAPNSGAGAGGKPRMSQAESDQNLKNALQGLQSIESELSTTGGPNHHPRAATNVQSAITELSTALNIR